MRAVIGALACAALLASGGAGKGAEPPAWAYAVNPPGLQPAPDVGTVQHVPGGAVGFTLHSTARPVQRAGLVSR